MERAEHGDPAARNLEQVREPGPAPGSSAPNVADAQRRPHRLVAERTERDDHPHPVEELELAPQVRRALVALGRCRLVRGRRAANGRGDVRVAQAPSPSSTATDVG